MPHSLQMQDGMWGRTMSLNPGDIKALSLGCSLSYPEAYYAEHLQIQVFPQERRSCSGFLRIYPNNINITNNNNILGTFSSKNMCR